MSSLSYNRSVSSNPLAVEQDLTLLLDEVDKNQATVLESLTDGNWRFDDAATTFDLDREIQKAATYTAKLRTIRHVMMETKRRLARLQERSLRVRNTADKLNEEAYKDWLEDTAYQTQLVAKFEPGNATHSSSKKRPDNI